MNKSQFRGKLLSDVTGVLKLSSDNLLDLYSKNVISTSKHLNILQNTKIPYRIPYPFIKSFDYPFFILV